MSTQRESQREPRIEREDTTTYYLTEEKRWGLKMTDAIGESRFGVLRFHDSDVVIMTIRCASFSFHEHLTVGEARLLGRALGLAADEIEATPAGAS